MSHVGHIYCVVKMEFILIFDVPRQSQSLKRQVHRLLIKADAKQIQFSVWKHKNLQSLTDIASFIKKSGGDARILEERFVF